MKLIILHHHLKPGGVTRIIASQLQALAGHNSFDIEILCGEAPHCPDYFPVPVTVEPLLNYLPQDMMCQPAQLKLHFLKLERFLADKIPTDALLHVHNLNLGKNPLLTLAVSRLALKGLKVFNHAHDFAEDRPDNYHDLEQVIVNTFKFNLTDVLYPICDNYRFGVLNRFDEKRLNQYGVASSRIEFLPNPVAFSDNKLLPSDAGRHVREHFKVDAEKQLFVYPVRAIRRKNIGELALLATLFKQRVEFVITLPPENPVEQTDYRNWVEFCGEHNINLHFEAGLRFSFTEIMAAADKCISTSRREGFGMMFLEPWLFGREIVGRDLKYVTDDFRASGIVFPALYEQLNVTHNSEIVDFAVLALDSQQDIIHLAFDNSEYIQELLNLNPQLEQMFASASAATINLNRNIIKTEYSVKKYGAKLNEIYQ
ncbi:MAG: hypothetical protein L3J71_03985 [Victivallaceae bacterium]|nr:hypothetical protein [Victivallaceae bacterium]